MTYSYDTENRLTGASGAKTASLLYDPLGRLIRVHDGNPANARWFVYDRNNLLAEFDTNGTMVKRYLQGPGTDEQLAWFDGNTITATTPRHDMFANAQGSIVAITNRSGTTEAINRYDEFGIPQSGNVGQFGFTGQAWIPELGLSYYKARMYSPSLGRFMQTDPIGYDDGPNWYNYVGGDPINLTDPAGLKGVRQEAGIVKPYCPTGDICVKAKRLPKHDVWSEKINIQDGIDQFRNIGVALGIGDGGSESNPCATSSISRSLENIADTADTATLVAGGVVLVGVAVAAVPIASVAAGGAVITAVGGAAFAFAANVNFGARAGLAASELVNGNEAGAWSHLANAAVGKFGPSMLMKGVGPVASASSAGGRATRVSANVQVSKTADVVQSAACKMIGN